jgi:hypothetical protein
MIFWTAAPMTVQGPRKGEPSLRSMRYGLRLQPAHLVRGSSRRIMSMRFRPANIRVINRRVSSSLLSALLSKPETLKAHQREGVPATPPVEGCSGCQNGARKARVRFAAPNASAPLHAPRRSGQRSMRRAAPTGTLHGRWAWVKKRKGWLPTCRRKASLTFGSN